MLRDWRNTKRRVEERPSLAHALREAQLERLADMLLMNSKVPDLQTTSDDLPQNDLLESVVKDIKEYYKRNICIIQADPTNNDVMFEFNHIYTDPTLLEEDRNDITKRNPLPYRNLLKTKINGQLSNRLLVQGGGGAGKTTFCSKIVWDWANDLGFQQFKLVAVIPVRKAKNKTVGDVIKSYLSDNNPFTAVQIDKYILTNQEDVFLVFDGLDELWEKLSDNSHQIVQIILNRLFKFGTVLVTSRQWRAHEIHRITELKKAYAFIYLDGFSPDNVTEYIKKFFNQDAASSQKLIDFINSNDVIADNMAPFPIYIAMLCIMWREYDGERRKAMSKLMTFSQLFDEMVDLLVDHCGSKDDSQTCPTVQELRQMIPNHLKTIGEIAFQGILDRRIEFPEDTFQSCRVSMELGCKVGVLTREKHATPRRDRRKNPCLEISMVHFPHQLFQEFLAAKFLASLYSSDHDRYERIMADILEKKEEFRYLLYFTSAQGSEHGLDIVTRLIAKHKASWLPQIAQSEFNYVRDFSHDYLIDREWRFIVDVAYESQHQSVAKKVGNQFMRSRKTLNITCHWSVHTVFGLLFIKDHLGEVDSLVLHKECGRIASQDLVEFILSSASLRTMRIGGPITSAFSLPMPSDMIPKHAAFYSILADKVQQCQIQNLTIYYASLHSQRQTSRDLAEFICQIPHLESLELRENKLHKDFFSKWASTISSAKVCHNKPIRRCSWSDICHLDKTLKPIGTTAGYMFIEAATTVEISSTTQPSRSLDVKEADKPHITQTLLMRAGDVESNPGPKRKPSDIKTHIQSTTAVSSQMTAPSIGVDLDALRTIKS
eukprot:XP_011665587.1 PREDICTED: uncharacterized protein LOC105438919 [Strongylocentrotus purpuratus]